MLFRSSTAISGGIVLADGGYPVTTRGVCWSKNPDPTVNDNITTNGSVTGVFTSQITGLSTSERYYVRAYATNSIGTGYGPSMQFDTKGGGLVDADGNHYAVKKIGSQTRFIVTFSIQENTCS